MTNEGSLILFNSSFAGGYNCAKAGEDGIWASAELYDPTTGSFSLTGSMGSPRENQTATLLADGRVLIAGGITGASPSAATVVTLASYRLVETSAGVLKTAEIFDPATGRVLTLRMVATAHFMHHVYSDFNRPVSISPPPSR